MNDEGLTPAHLRVELLSNLTVAIAFIPQPAIFAFFADMPPLVGVCGLPLGDYHGGDWRTAKDDVWFNGCNGYRVGDLSRRARR